MKNFQVYFVVLFLFLFSPFRFILLGFREVVTDSDSDDTLLLIILLLMSVSDALECPVITLHYIICKLVNTLRINSVLKKSWYHVWITFLLMKFLLDLLKMVLGNPFNCKSWIHSSGQCLLSVDALWTGSFGYVPGVVVPSLQLARHRMQVYGARAEPVARERVPFVVVEGPWTPRGMTGARGSGSRMIDLVRDPLEILQEKLRDPSNGFPINRAYYCLKQIAPAVSRFLVLDRTIDVSKWWDFAYAYP